MQQPAYLNERSWYNAARGICTSRYGIAYRTPISSSSQQSLWVLQKRCLSPSSAAHCRKCNTSSAPIWRATQQNESIKDGHRTSTPHAWPHSTVLRRLWWCPMLLIYLLLIYFTRSVASYSDLATRWKLFQPALWWFSYFRKNYKHQYASIILWIYYIYTHPEYITLVEALHVLLKPCYFSLNTANLKNVLIITLHTTTTHYLTSSQHLSCTLSIYSMFCFMKILKKICIQETKYSSCYENITKNVPACCCDSDDYGLSKSSVRRNEVIMHHLPSGAKHSHRLPSHSPKLSERSQA